MKNELIEKIREEAFELYEKTMRGIWKSSQFNLDKSLTNSMFCDMILNECIKDVYRKYSNTIKEEDTNKIYVYTGSYKVNKIMLGLDELFKDKAFIEGTAEYKVYSNLEGSFDKKIDLEDSKKFEEENTVLYGNFYKIEKDFIIEAVRNNQNAAVRKVIKKYKKRRKFGEK